MFLLNSSGRISEINVKIMPLLLRSKIFSILLCNKANVKQPVYYKVIICVRITNTRVRLSVSHRARPQVADRGMLSRYGGWVGNKIPPADQNS
jgi:hypothetical protein